MARPRPRGRGTRDPRRRRGWSRRRAGERPERESFDFVVERHQRDHDRDRGQEQDAGAPVDQGVWPGRGPEAEEHETPAGAEDGRAVGPVSAQSASPSISWLSATSVTTTVIAARSRTPVRRSIRAYGPAAAQRPRNTRPPPAPRMVAP